MQLMHANNVASPYLGLGSDYLTDLSKERNPRERDRFFQQPPSHINWASVASWFMRPDRSTPMPPVADFSLAPTICTSIRCTVPGCCCECFSPGKVHVRYCETCTHAWVPHALDKLGLGGGVEPVQATLAFDIASLVLYGCQALPIRLKILLDRLFSVLQRDEVAQILRGFGWSHDDYARGYIMQEHGAVLDRWNICSAEEEPLVLQQFLRFGETRAIAQQLLMHVMGDARYLPRMEADMKKLMERLRPPPKEDRPKPRPPLSPKQTPFVKPPSPPPVSSPAAVSPLNRLQSMQPFDFRKARASPERRSPPAGLNLSVASPGRPPHVARSPEFSSSLSVDASFASDDDDSENSQSALNLSKDAPKNKVSLRKPSTPVKRQWAPSALPPNLGTQLINPATGKKRVQCNVCLKTFCDKGALKIHFSAVHLREMHKCTVEGCNMMFSSRRSRNRHSANPNPKLHSPHLRRKISPHDGRTAQNHPIMIPQLASGLNPLGFGSFGSLLTPPSDLRQQAALDLKQSLDLSLVKQEEFRKDCSEQDYLDEEEEDGIMVEGDDFEPGKLKRAKLSESEGDDEVASNIDSNEDSLSVVDSQSAKEDNGPENLVTKSSRKRKNQNPTRCALPQVVQNNGDINSDDSSNELVFSKLQENVHIKEEMSEDLSMKKPKEDKSDNNNVIERESKSQSETSLNYSMNNNVEEELEKEDPSDLSVKKSEDSDKSEEEAACKRSDEGMDSSNALRQLESLSQGHFGELGKQEAEAGCCYGLGYLMNNPASPARSHSSSASSIGDSDDNEAGYLGFPDGFLPDIPIDKDNPRMCTACGKVFQNHFGVKTHYQNVHLKLMHKCTVDGCNAAFPSKRSRDRHSANLNLHRKLLSTPLSDKAVFLDGHMGGLNPSLHGEFLARLYGEQAMIPPPGLDMAPPVFLPRLAGFLPGFPPNGHAADSPLSSPEAPVLALPEEDLPGPDREGLLACRFCQAGLADGAALREHLEQKHLAELPRCSVPGCQLVFLCSARRNAHAQDPHPKLSS